MVIVAVAVTIGATLVASSPSQAQTPPVTGRGFLAPLEAAVWSPFLASGCHGNSDHKAGSFSVGVDATVAVDSPVFAVADGVVAYVSGPGRGWGEGNMALAIQHADPNGSGLFLGLYGHVRSTLAVDDPVVAGQAIGTVGPLDTIDPQLHFGVQAGIRMPPTNWGSMPCTVWPAGEAEPANTNGFIDPMPFIGLELASSESPAPAVPSETTIVGRGMADTCQYDPDPCSGVGMRAGPSNLSARLRDLAQGHLLLIECQTRGQTLTDSRGFSTDIWNRVTVDGVTGHVSDLWSTKVGWLDAPC